jgi:chromosome segregation ATPase
MEEALVKLGLSVYHVAGIIGVLLLLLSLVVVLLLRSYTHRITSQKKEIEHAMSKVEEMQDEIDRRSRQTLDDCEAKCKRKDEIIEAHVAKINELSQKVAVFERNEGWFRNEIRNLEDRVNELEHDDDIRTSRGKRKPRRRAQT